VALFLAFVFILTICVSILPASSNAAAKQVTIRITWWGNQTRHDRTQKVLEMYKKNVNRNVKFVAEFGIWSGYWGKLATQAAAKNLPDVIQMDYAYIGQYVSKGLLADMLPFTKTRALNLKDIDQVHLVGGTIDGKLYGISLGTNSLSFYYDPAIVQKAGVKIPSDGNWTWDDYKNIAKKIYQETKVKSPLNLFTDPKFLLEYNVRQVGKSLYNKDGSALGFTDEKLIIETFNVNLDLIKANVATKPQEVPLNASVEEDFVALGKNWCGIGWSNYFVSLANVSKRPLEITLLPKMKSGKRPGLYLKPSMFFSISENSKVKDEAAKFINYFVNNVEVNKVLLAERGVPISNKVRTELKKIVDKATQQTFDYIALVEKNCSPIDPPEPAGAAEVTKAFKDINDQVLYLQMKPEAAARQFLRQANLILAKNKK